MTSDRTLLGRLDTDVGASLVLGGAAVLALVWANVGGSYEGFWSTSAGLRIAGFDLSMSLSNWVQQPDLRWLAVVAAGLVVVWLLQRRGVWRVTPYLVAGLIIWYSTLRSGVDATLAGVLIALLMPVCLTRPREVVSVTLQARWYRQAPVPHTARMARRAIARSVPLNQRLSELLAPYVNFAVVPLFALANVGIPLSNETVAAAAVSCLTWGVIAGLVVGKFVGVFTFTALAGRLLPGSRGSALDGPKLAGVAALCGMSFTISLLVVDIALPNELLADEARIGVLVASLAALLIAAAVFRTADRLAPLPEPKGLRLPTPVDPVRDHLRGPAEAPVTIVSYAALDDLYRIGAAQAVADTLRHVGDHVAIVFRHHAIGDEQLTAALALEAAAAQGRFCQLYDAVVEARGPLSGADPEELVARAGLDADRFARDMTSQQYQGRVDEDNLDAEEAGLPERPVLFLQGRRFTQPADSHHIIAAVADELAKVAGR